MTTPALNAENYADIRRTVGQLHVEILKLTSRSDMHICGRHLGILRNKVLIFNNDIESHMLFDYLVYAYRPNGINMAELYLRTNRQRLDALRIDLLERMSNCLYLFLIAQSVGPGNSLQVLDVVRNKPLTLVDKSLSTNTEPGQAFGTHVIELGDFSIQTGAITGVDRGLMNADELVAAWAKWGKAKEYTTKISAKMAQAAMSAAIRLGYTENVRTVLLDESD